MEENCKEKTTFICRYGTYQFEVMPFGLMNAPFTFQRMMDQVFQNLGFVRVYLDDVVVYSSDKESCRTAWRSSLIERVFSLLGTQLRDVPIRRHQPTGVFPMPRTSSG